MTAPSPADGAPPSQKVSSPPAPPASLTPPAKPGFVARHRRKLIALAIGVSARCDGCIGFHVKALIRLGVTREQLMETLGICTYMGGGPSLMYAAEAVRAYDEFTSRTAKPA